MQLDKFVNSLPYEAFAELMKACTVRMTVELGKLQSAAKPLPAAPPAPSTSTIITPPPTTKPSTGYTLGEPPSPAKELLKHKASKFPIPTDVELTEEEKRLAREEGKVKAIKALKERFMGPDRRPKYTLLQCKGIVEAFMESEGIPLNAHHKK